MSWTQAVLRYELKIVWNLNFFIAPMCWHKYSCVCADVRIQWGWGWGQSIYRPEHNGWASKPTVNISLRLQSYGIHEVSYYRRTIGFPKDIVKMPKGKLRGMSTQWQPKGCVPIDEFYFTLLCSRTDIVCDNTAPGWVYSLCTSPITDI